MSTERWKRAQKAEKYWRSSRESWLNDDLGSYTFMSTERWKRAQKAEKKYWRSSRESWLNDDRRSYLQAQKAEKKYWRPSRESWLNDDRRSYWQEILARGFGLDYNFFTNKNVLDIGCGPNGIIFQIDIARFRIGIEPMELGDLIDEDWKKKMVKKGVGEELPFEDNSFDIVISFNALDHAINPEGVIRETHRVLRDNGDFLLWMFILRETYRPLQGILNKLDHPHPYHFTYDEIISKVKNNSFQISNRRQERGTGLKNDTVKSLFGNLMMNTAWIWSKKK